MSREPEPSVEPGTELGHEAPRVPEFVHLRRIAGLTPISTAQAGPAVVHSWAWTTVRDEAGTLIAMGRVIGDGGWYFHLADMATDPAHQRRGLGRRVLEDLLGRIRAVAPADPYITLMADPPGRRLYESLRFVDADPSLGMRLPARGAERPGA